MENKKEPLLTWVQWFYIQEKNGISENWVDEYISYATKWHLNNVKEVISEEAEIGFDGEWKITVHKQSITNAVDNYIEINLNK